MGDVQPLSKLGGGERAVLVQTQVSRARYSLFGSDG